MKGGVAIVKLRMVGGGLGDSRLLVVIGPARSTREKVADVLCGIGLLGRSASESGRLCRGLGARGAADAAGGC